MHIVFTEIEGFKKKKILITTILNSRGRGMGGERDSLLVLRAQVKNMSRITVLPKHASKLE